MKQPPIWDTLFLGVHFTSLCLAKALCQQGQRVALLSPSVTSPLSLKREDSFLFPFFFNRLYPYPAKTSFSTQSLELSFLSPSSVSSWKTISTQPNSLFSFTGKELLPCSLAELEAFCSAPYGRHLAYFLGSHYGNLPKPFKSWETQMIQDITKQEGCFFSAKEIPSWNFDPSPKQEGFPLLKSLTVKTFKEETPQVVFARQFICTLPLDTVPSYLPHQVVQSLSTGVPSKKKKLWSVLSLELFLPPSEWQVLTHDRSGLHFLYHRFYTTHPKGKYPLSQLSPVFGTQLEKGHFQWLCLFDSEVYGGVEETRALLQKMRRQIRQAYPFLFSPRSQKSRGSERIRCFPQAFLSILEESPSFQTSSPNLYGIGSYEVTESAFSPWFSLQKLPERLAMLSSNTLDLQKPLEKLSTLETC